MVLVHDIPFLPSTAETDDLSISIEGIPLVLLMCQEGENNRLPRTAGTSLHSCAEMNDGSFSALRATLSITADSEHPTPSEHFREPVSRAAE